MPPTATHCHPLPPTATPFRLTAAHHYRFSTAPTFHCNRSRASDDPAPPLSLLIGVFLYMSECIPSMKEAGAGSIVNVSSVNGMQSFAGTAAYCASKAAVDMLTQCAAVDLAEFQIRVNSVNPGVVVTELQKRGGLDEEKYAAFLERSRTVTHPVRWWMPLEMVVGGAGADKTEQRVLC